MFKISEGSDQNWSCPESALLAVSWDIHWNYKNYEKINDKKKLEKKIQFFFFFYNFFSENRVR